MEEKKEDMEKRREELRDKYYRLPMPTSLVELKIQLELGEINKETYEKREKEYYKNYSFGFGW